VNLANRISVARIIFVPFYVAAIVYSEFNIALIIFVLCIISDALDGYIARSRKQRTRLGSLLDPIADKLLLISGFISLSMVSSLPANLRFPPYVVIIIVSRDALIILGCMVIYLLRGDVDIKPTVLGKATTFFQMISIVGILVHFPYSIVLWNVAVALTAISGLDYLRIGSRMINESG